MIPPGVDEEALLILSEILPMAREWGVASGPVQPSSSSPIVGSRLIGLAALLTAKFCSLAEIIGIGRDHERLAVAMRLGATATVNRGVGHPAYALKKLTS